MFSNDIFDFYQSLRPPMSLPAGVETLFPQREPGVMKLVKAFLDKYYSDNRKRTLMLGINPGRFGAGATGINFTASRQLTQFCGIENTLKQQSELSAEFIYEVIEGYGGCDKFYGDFFISAVSPLGYVKDGKNMNYYDDKKLQEALTPFITRCIKEQYKWNLNKDVCICIGGEKNFKYLAALNEKHGWFKTIHPLPHPRFILQYRRKQKEEYIRQYLEVLRSSVGRN
ncbi:MAG: uracil-DNA glycosylase family protein [Chitinophagaceae bacterium]